ncbi:hypothetical protein COHA_007720 [Chlorella ohadii]|uniref:J domain-containing protein n=1 Tax=Chlorella ohadii TaxID=2649997 RepID=A0AAD5DI37_9CHLO|nr:hypothetical protein COHA_007720 [Chlorella ohadii]
MENAYQLLGLEQGPTATEADIKKAYRKLALVKHPDKNPDNPRAADEFAELQKAYDLLLDKEARAALDALVNEPAAGGQQGPAGAAGAQPDVLSDEMKERLTRTLKVSWSRKDGEYGAAQLRAIFAAHGPVEDVVLREGKKRKGSALVVMADAAGAAAAAGAVNGTLTNPLLVVPFNKAAAAAEGGEEAGAAAGSGLGGRTVDASATRLPPAATAPAFSAGAVPAGGLGPRPAAPLFAAGARSGSGAAAAQQPAAPLFAAAGAPSSFSARPAFAASSSGQAPARPAFAAAAAGGGSTGSAGGGSAAAFPAAFSSFGGLPGGGSSGVHALNGKLEDATLARMRQAEERRRLVEELEREQQQERQAG